MLICLESTHAGDLRIVRIDKVYSCCTGQEEIFIFVEKVNKSAFIVEASFFLMRLISTYILIFLLF